MIKTRLSKAIALCIVTSTAISTNNAHSDTFPVTVNYDNGTGLTANTLSWAILQANTNPGADEILLQTDVTVTGVMKRLIDSDTTLISDNTHRTISGSDQFRPLFIKSGHVTIKDLDITNGLAKGGGSTYGGKGAGLGGCLFIYDGDVLLTDTNFFSCRAISGDNGDNFNSTGGGGLFGDGLSSTGGGLFADGGYGGYGLYQNNSTNFGLGGSYGYTSPAGAGGFGGGGGYGYLVSGGQGGFGGGGGASYYQAGANGGFGGGGGTSQYGYGNGDPGFGGAQEDAAAFGGGIFIRSGQLNIINSSLSANRASNQNTQGEAFGGALFIMHTLTNNNGNNQGMPSTLPAVTLCGVQFSSNVADTTPQTFDNNNNVFDLANISIQSCAPEMEVFFGDQLINDGDNTPSDIDGTLFENIMLGQPEKKQTFTISNSNIGTLILNGNPVVEIQQSNNQFSITQMPQLTQIDLDATTTFEITFTPTVVGLDQATLSIANNDPDENPYDFVIAAEVIAPQPKLLVTHNGQAIAAEDETPSLTDGTDFGYTPVAGDLIQQTFEIHNVGFAPLELSNHTGSIHTVSLDNSMSISSQLSQFELQPNESIPFTVAFDPVQVGPASINYVNITSNDPEFYDYYFQVTGYGQATMYLNVLQADIQEGEGLAFEVATDLPVYDQASFQFALTGDVDESDFTQSSSVLSGQSFLTAGYRSTIFNFSTATDGIYEGVEHLTFGILSDDPAINQSTPFVVAGSIDDDLIYQNGFEALTVRQLNKKLNKQIGESLISCDYSDTLCTFLGQQINLANFPSDAQTRHYIEWLQYTIQSQQPQNDWDNDGTLNGQDASPFGFSINIIGNYETK